MEVSSIAAERVADKRASAPASAKIIQRAAELRRKAEGENASNGG